MPLETTMPLIGTLSIMPLPDLLQWLAAASKSGTLQVERDKVAKWIQMSHGRVVGCSSDDPPHRLGQYLISRGKLTPEQLREALITQEQSHQHLGRILVEMGLLTSDDLAAHLVSKAEETIYSLFDWEDAVFRFDEGLDTRENSFPVDLQVQDILLRGVKRVDEMQRIRQVFHDRGMVLRYTEKPPPAEIFSNKMARTLYATIDGDRSIAEVLLHVHGSEYVVYKFLFELHRNGYVEISHVKQVAAPLESGTPPSRLDPVVGRTGGELGGSGVTAAATIAGAQTRSAVLEAGGGDLRGAPPAGTGHALEHRLAETRRLIAEGQFEGALDILDALYRENPSDDSLRRLTAEAEAAFIDRAYRHYLPPDRIPVLTVPIEQLEASNLSPPDFFLLSRIDGVWDVKSIIQVAPLREVQALRTLKRMRETGMIQLK